MTKIISSQRQVYYGGIFLLLLFAALFILPESFFISTSVAAVALALGASFLIHLEWGLYLLAAVSFFTGWAVILNQYAIFKNIGFLANLDAPLADFIAIVLAGALIIAWLFRRRSAPRFSEWPIFSRPFFIYGLFIAAAMLSALLAYEHNIALSLRYVARFPLFLILAYVGLPLIIIQNRRILATILKIWWWVGVSVAVFGFSSLVMVTQQGWLRLVPYGIGSFAPLGFNHNLIAEVLVAIIPAGVWLAVRAWHNEHRDWAALYAGGASLMVLATLLTLSRAGWLSLVAEGVAVFILIPKTRQWLWKQKDWLKITGLGALLIGAYMAIFLVSDTALVSTKNRLIATEIVAYYVHGRPLWGYGPGLYRLLIGHTAAYVLDFGEPLEAHGFIQKIILENGLIGLALFVWFLFAAIKLLWHHAQLAGAAYQWLIGALVVMVTGEVIFQIFNTSYYSSVLWLPLGLAVSAVNLHLKNKL